MLLKGVDGLRPVDSESHRTLWDSNGWRLGQRRVNSAFDALLPISACWLSPIYLFSSANRYRTSKCRLKLVYERVYRPEWCSKPVPSVLSRQLPR